MIRDLGDEWDGDGRGCGLFRDCLDGVCLWSLGLVI